MKRPFLSVAAALLLCLSATPAHSVGFGGIGGLLRNGGSSSPLQNLRETVVVVRTQVAEATATAFAIANYTATVTPTHTPTSTASPSDTPVLSATPTVTGTSTPTATPTATMTFSASPTATPTATQTATPSATPTATSTYTVTSTSTASPTSSNTPTVSPTGTSTRTVTPTGTSSSTPTVSPTGTFTRTATPTGTSSSTRSPTSSATRTSTPANTATATPTSTSAASATVTPTSGPTTVVVMDAGNNKIWTYTSGTWSTTTYGNIPQSNPSAVAFDGAGNLYYSNGTNANIYQYVAGTGWNPSPITSVNVASFTGLAVIGSSTLWASYFYNAAGNHMSFSLPGFGAGAQVTSNGGASAASFGTNAWIGLGLAANQIIQVQGSSTGTINTSVAPKFIAFASATAGFYSDGTSVFNTAGANLGYPGSNPQYLACDSAGNLYVTDVVDAIVTGSTAGVRKYNGSSWTDIGPTDPNFTPEGVAVR